MKLMIPHTLHFFLKKDFLLIPALIVIASVTCLGQSEAGLRRLHQTLNGATNESTRIEALLKLSTYFIDQSVNNKKDRDSAASYLQQADSINTNGKYKELEMQTLLLTGANLVKGADTLKARSVFNKVTSYYHHTGNPGEEANSWLVYAISMTSPNDFAFRNAIMFRARRKMIYNPLILHELQVAMALAKQIKNNNLILRVSVQMADALFWAKRYDEVIQCYQQALPLASSDPEIKPYMLQYGLMRAYYRTGNYPAALTSALAALKNTEDLRATYDQNVIHSALGLVYNATQKDELAFKAIRSYISLSNTYHRPLDMLYVQHYAKIANRLGKQQDIAGILRSIRMEDPIYDGQQKSNYYELLADEALRFKRFELAEDHYQKFLSYLKGAPPLNQAEANMKMMIFYATWGKYNKAREYSIGLLDTLKVKMPAPNARIAHLYLFKLDSAAGDYPSAVKHLQAAQLIGNRLVNESSARAIEEYQIKYETEKKDQNIKLLTTEVRLQKLESVDKEKNNQLLHARILLKDAQGAKNEKNIQLLNTKVRLQKVQTANSQKNIQLLTSQGKLQKAELTRSNMIKNATIAGLLSVTIILGLLYNQYRQSKKASAEIDQKNKSLQQLLQDKEWLLKEIHHRVKNNLQIVISLLNTQSAYLDSEVALAAIQESQHRMRSISLIHQKLYQSDNVASIDMFDYISDLIAYLEESFSTEGNVEYDLQVEPMLLDVAQAVPVGLILNEAVTNSIKYAFKGLKKCRILIALDEDAQGAIRLTIADNGCGLAPGFDPAQSNSLGMSLMFGLSKQLGGDFKVENNEGLVITVSFLRNLMSQEAQSLLVTV